MIEVRIVILIFNPTTTGPTNPRAATQAYAMIKGPAVSKAVRVPLKSNISPFLYFPLKSLNLY